MAEHKTQPDMMQVRPFADIGRQAVVSAFDLMNNVELEKQAEIAQALAQVLGGLTTLDNLDSGVSAPASISESPTAARSAGSEDGTTRLLHTVKEIIKVGENIASTPLISEPAHDEATTEVPFISKNEAEDRDDAVTDLIANGEEVSDANETPVTEKESMDAKIRQKIIAFDKPKRRDAVAARHNLNGRSVDVFDADTSEIFRILAEKPDKPLQSRHFIEAGFGNAKRTVAAERQAFSHAVNRFMTNPHLKVLGIEVFGERAGRRVVYRPFPEQLPPSSDNNAVSGNGVSDKVPGSQRSLTDFSKTIVVSRQEKGFKEYHLRLSKRGLAVERHTNGTFDVTIDKVSLNLLNPEEVAPMLLALALREDVDYINSRKVLDRMRCLGVDRITPQEVNLILHSAVQALFYKQRSHLRQARQGREVLYILEGHEAWDKEDILHSLVNLGYTKEQARDFLRK